MRTQDIAYVLEVARQGNLTKASKDLFVTPPTLSEAVKRVETELGVDLFLRSNRGMSLTAKGKELLVELEAIAAADTRLRSTAQPSEAATTTIRIGCPQGAWHKIISHTATLLDEHTSTFTVATDVFGPMDSFFDDAIDFALLPARSDHDGLLTRIPLFTEPRLVSIAQSLMAPRASATLEELDEFPWMGRPGDTDMTYTSEHRCDDLRGGPPPLIGPHFSNPHDIGAAMAAGDFIVAGFPSISNLFNMSDRGLTDVAIEGAPPWRVDLVALKSQPRSLPISVEEMASVLCEAMKTDPLLTPV